MVQVAALGMVLHENGTVWLRMAFGAGMCFEQGERLQSSNPKQSQRYPWSQRPRRQVLLC